MRKGREGETGSKRKLKKSRVGSELRERFGRVGLKALCHFYSLQFCQDSKGALSPSATTESQGGWSWA